MKEITGLMVYYYFVCKRKLWYFSNNLGMEQDNELIRIGAVIDESTYSRERKQIMINNNINIDFVKKDVVLHEVKKSKSIEEAGIWQLKYYMYYLEKRNVKNIKAKIDFPLLKKTEDVFLSDEDRQYMSNVLNDITNIISYDKPPSIINNKICKKCAYFDMCYI